MDKEIHGILTRAGWRDGEFIVKREGNRVTVALGGKLVGTTPAHGGNAAGSLAWVLRGAGFELSPANWEHLLAGGVSVVTRIPTYTSRELAVRLYGPNPSRHQVTAASQWAAPRMRQVNPGARVARWPAVEADAALAERAALLATGKANRGNQTRGAVRSDAARRGWGTRRGHPNG